MAECVHGIHGQHELLELVEAENRSMAFMQSVSLGSNSWSADSPPYVTKENQKEMQIQFIASDTTPMFRTEASYFLLFAGATEQADQQLWEGREEEEARAPAAVLRVVDAAITGSNASTASMSRQ